MAGELLRFATAGSVDDGKSTLIGRLLLETKQIFEDQLESIERSSRDRGFDYTNLALLTDGLRAERGRVTVPSSLPGRVSHGNALHPGLRGGCTRLAPDCRLIRLHRA